MTMGLRVKEEDELIGLDVSQHGERAYQLEARLRRYPGDARARGATPPAPSTNPAQRADLERTIRTVNKVEAIVRPERLEVVKEALATAGFVGLNIVSVTGRGIQKGIVHTGRGGEEYRVDMLPKSKIELVVTDANTDKCVTSSSRHRGPARSVTARSSSARCRTQSASVPESEAKRRSNRKCRNR